MAYPSTIGALTNPAATQQLNSPSHSGIESNQNTEITAIETFVGTLSSTVGTLVYDIRAAASSGGGHVQAANVGGTGQTSYNKGDILAASSSSVLGKIAIGADTQVLSADSTQTSGVKWAGVATATNIQNETYQYAQDGGTGSVYAIAPSACVLSYVTGQLFTMRATASNTVTSPALSVSSLLAQKIQNTDGTALTVGQIKSSSIGLYVYDGTASVFQAVSTPPVNYKLGVTTRDISLTGTQTIAHGLPTTPKYVKFTATVTGASRMSFEAYNGTTYAGVGMVGTSSSFTDSSNVISLNDGAGNNASATIALDAVNLTLTWSKAGSPTGTANIFWEAFS